MKKVDLYVAHPGHELALTTWIRTNRSRVNILTDGSGSSGQPRIDSSKRLCRDLGASKGQLFGNFSDLEVYRAILDKNINWFQGIIQRIVSGWMSETPDIVVVDELDGHNSCHDLMNLLVTGACKAYERLTGNRIPLYCYYLIQWQKPASGAIAHELAPEERSFKRKRLLDYEVKPKNVDIVMCRYGINCLLDFPRFFEAHCRSLGVEPTKEMMDDATDENQGEIDIYHRISQRVREEALLLQIKFPKSYPKPSEDTSNRELMNPVDFDRTKALEAYPTTFYELYGEEKTRIGVYRDVIRQHQLRAIWTEINGA